jgi:voltage-gated potassium channel Kch
VHNPARLAAATFVDALDAPISRSLKYAPPLQPQPGGRRVTDRLLWGLGGLFVTLATAAIAYFHAAEQLSWVDSTYFVIVTVATVGYGDINLLNASATSKLIGVALILGSTFFIWMIFSLTIDRIIKKRVQLALGRRKYALEHHVVLCGLGRLGYFIADALLERGEKLLIIEQSEQTAAVEHFRSRGAAVYIGDARALGVLQDVAISEAKALFAVISNDYVNLEIGLNARSLKPDLRLVLRVFDHSMSEMIKENLDIHLTFSMSAIVDQKFLDSAGLR